MALQVEQMNVQDEAYPPQMTIRDGAHGNPKTDMRWAWSAVPDSRYRVVDVLQSVQAVMNPRHSNVFRTECALDNHLVEADNAATGKVWKNVGCAQQVDVVQSALAVLGAKHLDMHVLRAVLAPHVPQLLAESTPIEEDEMDGNADNCRGHMMTLDSRAIVVVLQVGISAQNNRSCAPDYREERTAFV